MARITYGALVTEIKGSVGGTTFQNNAQGFSIKNKGYQRNPRSTLQIARRSNLQQAIRMWQNLTNNERLNWAAWCATYPQYSKNDPLKLISAYNAFLRYQTTYNLYELEAAGTPVFAPRIVWPMSFQITSEPGFLWFYVNGTESIESNNLFLFLSRPIGACQNFQRTQTRYIAHFLDVNQGFQIGSEYFANFGMLPIDGDQIYMRIIFLGMGTGQYVQVYFGKITVIQQT
jgi:hypothetical protein